MLAAWKKIKVVDAVNLDTYIGRAKKELLQVTEPRNLRKLAQDLEAAGMDVSAVGGGTSDAEKRRKITPGNEQDTVEGRKMIKEFLGDGTDNSKDIGASDEYKKRTATAAAVKNIRLTRKNLQRMIEDDFPFPFGFLLCVHFNATICAPLSCVAGKGSTNLIAIQTSNLQIMSLTRRM